MIRLDNISKQNGHQILFIDASMGIQKGEKVGLVGPNGSGKTTIFRMIAGEERPDDGLVSIDPGMTIGYFSQDVGEMSGQSAVAAVMDGVGPVSALATEMAKLEAAMVDPDAGPATWIPSSLDMARCRRASRSWMAMRWMPARARCSQG